MKYYSYSRVSKYYKATSHNKAKTIILYNGNLKISQAFYPLPGALEVILRNRIHREMAFMIIAWVDPKIQTSLLEIDRVLKVIDDEERKQNKP